MSVDDVLGADTESIRALAVDLSESATNIRFRTTRLLGDLRQLEWSGTDGDQFRRSCQRDVDLLLAKVARRLDEAAKILRREGDQQVRASAWSGDVVVQTRPLTSTPPAGSSQSPARVRSLADLPRFGSTPHRVLFSDPAGDGRIAVLVGSFDHVRHVAVLVPGMGTEASDIGALVTEAERIRASAEAVGGSTAVVAWIGYDAPKGLEDQARFEAASEGQAIEGGVALTAFVAHLRGMTDAPLTVIGHSYGSTVVGDAAKDGMDADRLVVLGSPGMSAESTDDLHLPAGTEVFAAAIPGDPVAHLQWFGDNPTAPGFGAQTFDTGPGRPITANPFDNHSGYFEEGSLSLANIGRIVAGASPSARVPTPIESVVGAADEVRDSINHGIDQAQQIVTVPFVDRTFDQIVDGAQAVEQAERRVVDGVVTYVDDLVEKLGLW